MCLQSCAKEIIYPESKENTDAKVDTPSVDKPASPSRQSSITLVDTADQQGATVSLADQSDITKVNAADQSGISLNSSYLTLSAVETSSLSQGTEDLMIRTLCYKVRRRDKVHI